MKKYLFGTLIAVLLSSTVVFAANYLYHADEISYTPRNNNWNVSDVKGAIDDLYDKAGNSGAIYLGEYSSNTTIDVSNLGATSVDQFISSISDGSGSAGGSFQGSNAIYGYVKSDIYAPVLTLSNNQLTITVGRCAATGGNAGGQTPLVNTNFNLKTKVYYVGNIKENN